MFPIAGYKAGPNQLIFFIILNTCLISADWANAKDTIGVVSVSSSITLTGTEFNVFGKGR